MDDLDLGATIRGFSAGQKVFGRFVLKRILGRGGMGVVWLARDEKLDEPVALKFLPEVVKLDPGALDDLKRETKRARQLTHPNIVRIHDFLEDAHAAAIAMEAVEGTTLAQRRVDQPSRVFDPAALREWVRQLCATLDYAHLDARVVHRDLKPANVMVDVRGRVKITDFGISQSLSDSLSRASVQRSSSGTPAYMSPQQMMGERPSPADDIYALGATLYELLTSRPPFHSGNIIAQVQTVVPPAIAVRRRDLDVPDGPIPPEWEATIAACLAKEPAARPPTAGAVWTGLNTPVPTARVGASRQAAPSAPEPPVLPRSEASTSTLPARALILGSVLALVVAAGAAFWWVHQANRRAHENASPLPPVTPANQPEDAKMLPVRDAPAIVLPEPTVSVVVPASAGLRAVNALAAAGEAHYAAGTLEDGRRAILAIDPATGEVRPLYYPSDPVALAVAGEYLFWIDPNSGPASDTQIMRAPVDGGGSPEPIYTGIERGEPIVDGSGLAWLAADEGAVLGEGAPGRLLAIDQFAGRVVRMELDGSQITSLVRDRYTAGFSSEHRQAIAALGAGGFVLVGSGRAGVAEPVVARYQSENDSLQDLWRGPPLVSPVAVTAADDVVYVADPGAAAVWCLPITGKVIRRLALPAGQLDPNARIVSVAAEAGGGLLAGTEGAGGSVYRIGNLPTSHQLIFGALADDPNVYFTYSGLGVHILSEGEGINYGAGARVRFAFTARDLHGRVLQASTPEQPTTGTLGEGLFAAGTEEALMLLKPGGSGRFLIPPHLGSALFFASENSAEPSGIVLELSFLGVD